MLDWLRISKFLSFQNILCYCLSCGLSAAGDVRRNFKTSYVIVYHKYHFLVYMHLLYFKTSYVIVYLSGVMNLAAASGFQNILCYCLSCTVDPFQRLQFVFQNILCYCLSTLRYLALWSF